MKFCQATPLVEPSNLDVFVKINASGSQDWQRPWHHLAFTVLYVGEGFFNLYLLFYVYQCFAYMCVCIMCVPGTPGDQKKMSHPLELES